MTLKDRIIIITGASRGIGREMAIKFAADGAVIVIAAKSSDPHPKLPGTIHTVAKEVEEAGGTAIPIQIDVRDDENIKKLCDGIGEKFGRIDAIINNAGVIHVQGVEPTPPKKLDLMYQVNQRAVFCFAHFALPWLEQSDNPHILSLSPPISMNDAWFKDYSPYTTTKYSMSMLTKGMALEFRNKRDGRGIRVNSLWPQTYIATAAIGFAAGTDEVYKVARKPTIMADAAYEILTTDKYNGEWLIDEKVLRAAGITDFLPYANDPDFAAHIKRDLFVDEDVVNDSNPSETSNLEAFKHNPDQSRFELHLGKYLAEINYRKAGNIYYLNRVFTPVDLRGQGVAGRLTKLSLEWIENEDARIVPVCPYVVAYLKRKPEWQRLVSDKHLA